MNHCIKRGVNLVAPILCISLLHVILAKKPEMVSLLLSLGVSLHVTCEFIDGQKLSPLMVAVSQGEPQIVELLLANCANSNDFLTVANGDIFTVLDMVRDKNVEVEIFLKEAGAISGQELKALSSESDLC